MTGVIGGLWFEEICRSQRRGDRLADTLRQRLDARLIPGDRLRMRVKGLAASGGGGEWGGGGFLMTQQQFCLQKRVSAQTQTVRKQPTMRMPLSLLFWILISLSFFPPTCVYLNSSPGRNESAEKRSKRSLCAVIAGWQGDAVLALLAGPGPRTHHVFTQRLHLVCVSGAHSYKYKGVGGVNPYNPGTRLHNPDCARVNTHTLFLL